MVWGLCDCLVDLTFITKDTTRVSFVTFQRSCQHTGSKPEMRFHCAAEES